MILCTSTFYSGVDVKLDDLTGQRFGLLKVTHRWSEIGESASWHCTCDCGATTVASAHHLKDGTTKSCGCLRLKRVDDLTGMRFHRLTVIERGPNRGTGTKTKAQWRCSCECGEMVVIPGYSLKTGNTKSCGCLRREKNIENGKKLNLSHGMSGTRVHTIWACMIQRCLYPKHKSYADYGGRGITICERWMKFENFFADMGEPPDGLTLERGENNGNYEPGNCRWATLIEQANNRRNNVKITAFGKTQTIAVWCRETGYLKSKLIYRLATMTPEDALATASNPSAGHTAV